MVSAWRKKRITGRMLLPMKEQILKAALALTICLQATSLIAATDTPETRRREAERYLTAIPPKAMFEDMADKNDDESATGTAGAVQAVTHTAARHRGSDQSDDRRDGETFYDRRAEGTGRFLRLAGWKIGHAEIWCLHGRSHADHAG